MTAEKTPIIDLHLAIQGEGSLMGRSSILIRTSGCNLACVFENSICDTPYSSHNPEKGRYSLDDVNDFVKKYPKIESLIVSGGEPCLHSEFIERILDMFPNHHTTIETNGSIALSTSLMSRVDLVSISPKLSTSTMTREKAERLEIPYNEVLSKRHEAMRENSDAVGKWVEWTRDYQLKYVINKEEDVTEVKAQLKLLEGNDVFILNEKVYLMPAGITNEQLQENRQWLMEKCLELGFSYSDRLQVIAYGNRRDV